MRTTNLFMLGLFMATWSMMDEQVRAEENTLAPVAVLELFTSQGCSSCPSADKLLAQQAADAKKRGQKIYCLSFHVDYWDRLGWKDPFADKLYTTRQKMYAAAWNLRSIYTPQLVVNGTQEFVGSDARRLQKSRDAALAENAAVAVTLQATRGRDQTLAVEYHLNTARANAVLNLALVEAELERKVTRGENAGRTLKHANVVRAFTLVKLNETQGKATLTIPRDVAWENATLIGYVQDAGSLAILGANAIRPTHSVER